MNKLEYLAGLNGFEIPEEIKKCNYTEICVMQGCDGYRDCKQIKRFYDKWYKKEVTMAIRRNNFGNF